MARAVFQHELQDPDFSWLITKFQELNPHYKLIDSSFLPLVLVRMDTIVLSEDLSEADPELDLPVEPGKRE